MRALLTPRPARRARRSQPLLDALEPRILLTTFPNEVNLTFPEFSDLWHLNNTGQTLTAHPVGPATGTPGADISAPTAWDFTQGSNNVVVAVFDTGVDITHPDLAANIFTNPGIIDQFNGADVHGWNFLNNNADVSDTVGHGTMVAGVIGAVGNNDLGIAGVNWHVSILPIKVGDSFGIDTTAVVNGINYVVDLKRRGVNIVAINASFESLGPPSAAQINAIGTARDAGILYVNAAGNDATDISSLNFLPGWTGLTNRITVAATNDQDQFATFSNFSPSVVQLAAPGVDILSTTILDSYAVDSGTSFAAPMVSGTVALLAAESPTATATQLKNAILNSVDPIPSLAGLVLTGGRLDAAAALQALIGNPDPFGHVDVVTSSVLSGWAFDSNAGNQPINVRLDIDGKTVSTVTANQNRPDLQNFLGSSDHGFTFNVPALGPGNHTAQLFMIDVPSGNPVLLATETLTGSSQTPIGNVDILTPTQIVGWAASPDSPATAISVRIDIDGTPLTTVTADLSRPDLQNFLGSSNHGFDVALPSLTSGFHRIEVFALDAVTQAPILISTQTLGTAPPPFGQVDIFDPTHIVGWAFAPDAGASAIAVRFEIDGTPQPLVTANLSRPDLQNFLGSSDHGFDIALPALSTGTHTIKVEAVDPVTSGLVLLTFGTGTVTITPAARVPVGNIDILTASQIAGWAFSPVAGTAPVSVRIDIDGTPGTPFLANLSRPDLQKPFGSANHGFSFTPPALSAGAHRVNLVAIDPQNNTPVLIQSRLLNDPAPIGHADIFTSTTIAGWAAWTANTPQPISVRLDIDNTFGPLITADLSRPDLQNFLGSSNHGFFFATPSLPAGPHHLTLVAIDPFTLTPTTLASATIVFA